MVTVDEFSGDPAAVVALACALEPFPPARSAYPGRRRLLAESDGAAMDYVHRTLEAAAPFIAGAFGCDRFELLEASFSLVTSSPEALHPVQRRPHFDSLDPDDVAVMHYLAHTAGTAFFRQSATDVEVVDTNNVVAFKRAAEAVDPSLHGYMIDTNPAFQRIGLVQGRLDRLVFYQGALLHSGVISPGQPLSADPRQGRLTANLFVRLRR